MLLLLLLINARISIASASASVVVVECRRCGRCSAIVGFLVDAGDFDCKYFPIESARRVTYVTNFVSGCPNLEKGGPCTALGFIMLEEV
jgi:hypothetical protein